MCIIMLFCLVNLKGVKSMNVNCLNICASCFYKLVPVMDVTKCCVSCTVQDAGTCLQMSACMSMHVSGTYVVHIA